jgi:hypothetical protein
VTPNNLVDRFILYIRKLFQYLHLYKLLKIFHDIWKMDPFNHTIMQQRAIFIYLLIYTHGDGIQTETCSVIVITN